MGQSALEDLVLTDVTGQETGLLRAVERVVEQVSPGALDRAGLRQTLYTKFGGRRWFGAADNMLAGGDVLAVAVPVGRYSVEQLIIRVTAGLGEEAIRLGHAPDVGLILQNYSFREVNRAGGSGGVLTGSAGGSATPLSGPAGSVPVGLSGGRGHTLDATVGAQDTTLQRIAGPWTGVDRVRRPLGLTVTVTRVHPFAAGLPRLINGVRLRNLPTSATVDLTGSVVQLVPDGPVRARPPGGHAARRLRGGGHRQW